VSSNFHPSWTENITELQ